MPISANTDGAVVISVDLDPTKAQKELNRLTKEIDKTRVDLSKNQSQKSGIEKELTAAKNEALKTEQTIQRLKAELAQTQSVTDVNGPGRADPTAFMAAKERQAQLTAQLKEQETILKQQDKETERLDAAYTKITDKVVAQTQALEIAETRAGELSAELLNAGGNTNYMAEAVNRAEKYMEKITNRVKGLARRVLFFSVITMALRSMRDWLGKVVKTSPEATSAIAKLKGALLTMAQPLVNVIIPKLTEFVSLLSRIITEIANVAAFLSGTTLESSAQAAEDLYEEQQALDGVSSSAKKASKALASFDEINQLSGGSSSSGGGASSGSIAPDFSALKDGLLSNLAFSMKDILFNWKDLTAEDILAKIVTGLGAIAGGIIGFTVGGPGGAVIGIMVGAGLGLALSNILFNGDGKIDGEELLKTLMVALAAIAGGIIGFTLGGPGGAALGILIGAGVAILVSGILFDGDGQLNSEEIVSALLTVLGALAGGIIGFVMGGPAGAAVGLLLGAGVAISLTDMIFNSDGVIGQDEILTGLTVALGALVGGIIGFIAGGPAGAIVGIVFGAGVTAMIASLSFDGENALISKDKILKLLSDALFIVCGGVIGFAVGGIPGAVIGMTIAAGVSTIISNIEFGGNGGLNANTILKLLLDALFMICGGLIGFVVGGPLGAVVGMTIGAGISLAVKNVSFDDETASKNAGYEEGRRVGDNAIDGARDSLGVNSPSTEFQQIGDYMMQGMANGITNDQPLVTTAFQAVLDALSLTFDTWQLNFMTGFGSFQSAFRSQWQSFWYSMSVYLTNAWNSMLDTLQSAINSAVSSLNRLVSAANSLSLLTGRHYSKIGAITVSKISLPRLAQGAVIPPNREFMAVLGDQKSGTNIETPLATMVQAFKQAMQEGGYGGNSTIIMEVDGQQFAKVVYNANKSESRRVGVNLAEV